MAQLSSNLENIEQHLMLAKPLLEEEWVSSRIVAVVKDTKIGLCLIFQSRKLTDVQKTLQTWLEGIVGMGTSEVQGNCCTRRTTSTQRIPTGYTTIKENNNIQ